MPPDATPVFDEVETAWIPLGDGIRLAARIWLPSGTETRPVPAVLEFLPYRRRDVTAPRDESTYPGFAAQGIAGVRVDMRGTGDSGGVFDDEYSETELADAEAVIAWIAAQPWCSGRVGMMGISWGGFNALQVAARCPPALKAVISIASSVDRFADDIHYKGGCQLSAQLYWSTTMMGNVARPPDAAVVGDAWRKMWLARLGGIEPLIFPWLAHQRRDAYWRHGSICENFADLEAPALVIAGWADGYRNTPWKAVAGLRPASKALTGPWIHKYPHFAWPRPRIDFDAEAGRWWCHWLGGSGAGAGAEILPRHRLFLSEAVRPGGRREDERGRWIALDADAGSGPAAMRSGRRLFLSPHRRLTNEPGPAGSVTVRSPLDCGADGGEFFAVNADTDLPADQRLDDAISVCFETGPLAAPVDVIGAPVLSLPVAIDAPVGTLIARLVDVHPDGAAHRVSLGVLNLTHRSGSAAPGPMTPGRAETVAVTLDVTGYRFLPGHRIRLALSTSYFPLVLPPPTDVTAALATGPGARLDLPTARFREIDIPAPKDPAPLPVYPREGSGGNHRDVLRRRTGARTTVTVTADTGTLRHPANGMVWREERRSDWSIARGDPLSFEGREKMVAMRRRDGIETVCTATSRLTATATHWIVEAALSATENGQSCFSRNWAREIRRDLM